MLLFFKFLNILIIECMSICVLVVEMFGCRKLRFKYTLLLSSVFCLHSTYFLARPILWPWSWSRYASSKRRLTFNELHGTLHYHRCGNLKSYFLFYFSQIYNLLYKWSNKQILVCCKETLVRSDHPMMILLYILCIMLCVLLLFFLSLDL
jgi:hypothetical protein